MIQSEFVQWCWISGGLNGRVAQLRRTSFRSDEAFVYFGMLKWKLGTVFFVLISTGWTLSQSRSKIRISRSNDETSFREQKTRYFRFCQVFVKYVQSTNAMYHISKWKSAVSYSGKGPRFNSPHGLFERKFLNAIPHPQTENHSVTGLHLNSNKLNLQKSELSALHPR